MTGAYSNFTVTLEIDSLGTHWNFVCGPIRFCHLENIVILVLSNFVVAQKIMAKDGNCVFFDDTPSDTVSLIVTDNGSGKLPQQAQQMIQR